MSYPNYSKSEIRENIKKVLEKNGKNLRLKIDLNLLLLWLENLNLEQGEEVEKFERRIEEIGKTYNVQELKNLKIGLLNAKKNEEENFKPNFLNSSP
jgi:hypothetical protein